MNKQKQKEQLSLRIAKTTLVIAIITGLGTIIFGGGVVIMKYYGNEANNRIVEPVEQETENYYNALEKKCAGGNCCLSSLKFMKENNYREALKNGCPEGFRINSLWCSGAYSWCEPVKEAEIDSMFYCDSKKDCVVVNFNCGFCECDLRAVNKNYKNEICKNFTGEYCDKICKDVNCKCVNNRCEIAGWAWF